VDAIRFSPYPNPPARVIDVYSLGRRLDGLHRTLLKFTAERNMFYVYETLQAGADCVGLDWTVDIAAARKLVLAHQQCAEVVFWPFQAEDLQPRRLGALQGKKPSKPRNISAPRRVPHGEPRLDDPRDTASRAFHESDARHATNDRVGIDLLHLFGGENAH
jgi:hypothetical protein